jgi:hypothetical protein
VDQDAIYTSRLERELAAEVAGVEVLNLIADTLRPVLAALLQQRAPRGLRYVYEPW